MMRLITTIIIATIIGFTFVSAETPSGALDSNKEFWKQFPIKSQNIRSFQLSGLERYNVLVQPSFKNGKTSEILWKIPSQMPGKVLWALLDWVGEGYDWLEVDFKASLNPMIKKALSSKEGRGEMAWVLRKNNQIIAVAKLVNHVNSTQSLVVKKIDLAKVKYQEPKFIYNDPQYSFSNFQAIGSEMCFLKKKPDCQFVNLDNKAITSKLDGSNIVFKYQKLDAKRLGAYKGYKSLNPVQKRQMIEDWIGFLRYEYSIMLRAFIYPTRGIFSWQDWNWMDNWHENFISKDEIESFLLAEQIPPELTIYRLKLKNNIVEFTCDLNGNYTLTIADSK